PLRSGCLGFYCQGAKQPDPNRPKPSRPHPLRPDHILAPPGPPSRPGPASPLVLALMPTAWRNAGGGLPYRAPAAGWVLTPWA
ncbi:MAG: hypothetical protein LBC53_09650, partial [Spirochaetaceae bacterium]|nr:hypothetical protein [Spirochaetaceae bacterium]